MDYRLILFCLVAFILGRMSKGFKIYIGPDVKKYEKATLGILLKEKRL